MKNIFRYVKPTDQFLFQLDFQKVDRHAGGKWIIQSTKHSKGNLLFLYLREARNILMH